jgi:hypothetical protein
MPRYHLDLVLVSIEVYGPSPQHRATAFSHNGET